MRQVTIFRLLRDPNDHAKIVGKQTIRIVNVHDTFEGNGAKGAINKAEFKKLVDDLEPYNDGYDLT